jgi:N6-L-threonylcarbamoyladenine synthase
MSARNSLEFSFSGLKTNVMRYVAANGVPTEIQQLQNLCASFQHRVVETLTKKAMRAVHQENVRTLVLGGGVAANQGLREALRTACDQRQIQLVIPPMRACTDNAAMIAFVGAQRLRRGDNDAQHLQMSPHTALQTVTRKGPGRRAAHQRAT